MKWFKFIVQAVRNAEHEFDTSETKREGAVKFINGVLAIKVIDIPLLPEWLEERVFALLVDYTVYLYNKHFGHDWINKS